MVFLICMFLFIPIPFVSKWIAQGEENGEFPHHEVSFSCLTTFIALQRFMPFGGKCLLQLVTIITDPQHTALGGRGVVAPRKWPEKLWL